MNVPSTDYNTAIERNTDLAEPYYNRGMVFVLLQEWEKAKEDLDNCQRQAGKYHHSAVS